MKSSQLIREQLGLSQEVLAFYLGITKSLLAMYERGKREIPIAALVKLAEMELFLNQNFENTKEQNNLQKQQETKVASLLEHYFKELEYKQLVEQRKLEALQKKYNQSLKLMAFVVQLDEVKSISSELLQLQANTGIEKNGLIAQTIQQLKLESINGQLSYCKSVKEKQMKS
ncbi:MAG: helix-turn-helix transcriptional regulator [Flavobacteriaceae bacterium]|nr:helix-turn-helix transcriptional regulator [Flavobacteriaceae bacterium]